MTDCNRYRALARRGGASLLLAACAFLAIPPALAGPGAHGPGGEHLDQPGGSVAAPSARPRLEARSDLFELVAVHTGGELSILVDRYETNEPVLGAELEVESGGRKAKARFHADYGTYAVDDPAFLQAIAAPGEHALVFTLKTGNDADLLDGTLAVRPHEAANASHAGGWTRAIRSNFVPLLIAAAVVAGIVGLLRSRRRAKGSPDQLRRAP